MAPGERIHDGGNVVVCHVRSAIATHEIALECPPDWSAAALAAQLFVELGRESAADQLSDVRVVAPDARMLDHDEPLGTIDADHCFVILPDAADGADHDYGDGHGGGG